MLKSASWQSDLPRGTQSRNNLSHDGTQRIPVLAMKSMWPGNWTKGVSILSCRCIEVCDDGKTVARKLNCLSSPATFSYILTWNNGCAYWNSPRGSAGEFQWPTGDATGIRDRDVTKRFGPADLRRTSSLFARGPKGTRVAWAHGCTEGILVRKKDKFRLVISLEAIMRSTAVEVDAADVQPA